MTTYEAYVWVNPDNEIAGVFLKTPLSVLFWEKVSVRLTGREFYNMDDINTVMEGLGRGRLIATTGLIFSNLLEI